MLMFYGISTIIGYLKPKRFYTQTVLFQTIQFSINTQFGSIQPVHRKLSGANTPGLSGPGINGYEGVLNISQIFKAGV